MIQVDNEKVEGPRPTAAEALWTSCMAAHVVLVEDTAQLAASIARGLSEDDFVVTAVSSAEAAERQLRASPGDVVILDLGLPDGDGMDLLRGLRRAGATVPVLVLTARDAVSARVAALEAGADDYVIKPFAFAELVARMRALLRRAAAPRWASLAWAGLRLDQNEADAVVAGKRVGLSPRERALLEYLLRRRGEIVNRREILATVFGYDFDPGTNLVDVHVAHLRRKLVHSGVAIDTVRGVGYRLVLAAASD